MVLISPNIALIVFIAIIILAIIIAWYMGEFESYDKGSFHVFIAVLTGLGVLVTFLFYYNLVQLQNQQQELATITELSRINDVELNSVLDEIQKASILIPNFVLSITPLTNTICCVNPVSECAIPVRDDPINPQTCTEKFALSYRIFSLWQDVILSNRLIAINSLPYITNFLQRANSSQLYTQWTVNKINFSSNTQLLGDLLFQYGLPVTVQTPESYIDAANKLILDPRYPQVFC
jgi:hypothetical protein